MDHKFLTVDEVSKYLRLHKQKVYRYTQRGKIPAYKFGREWRFRTDQLEQWIEAQKVSKNKRK